MCFELARDHTRRPTIYKVVNMENIKFTPQGWHWKITPEQIEKIKERDRDTVNKVYFDNYDKFERLAKWYCDIIKRRELVDDCTQQIYADIIDYDYTDTRTLFYSIRRSFWTACGCRTTKYDFVSLDETLYDDGETILADILPSTYDITQEAENKENERHALELIAAQTHLSDKNKDILTAIAFGCLAYQGLFAYEYAQAVAV